MQGANLNKTVLQGADLTFAQLQGVDLSGAHLSDSVFAQAFVFRTKVANAHLTTATIRSVRSDQVKLDDEGKIETLNRTRFARLKPLQANEQDKRDEETWKDLVDSNRA